MRIYSVGCGEVFIAYENNSRAKKEGAYKVITIILMDHE